jgi:hypothetical protein
MQQGNGEEMGHEEEVSRVGRGIEREGHLLRVPTVHFDCVSPDILLHPATHQCTGTCLHSGALLQRQRNELLSVPSAPHQKVHF